MTVSLDNDHNVYILGAGFSREAGFPLIADFIDQMRDGLPWLEQNSRLEVGAVKKVLELKRRAAAAGQWMNLDLANIEELFSAAAFEEQAIYDEIIQAMSATLDYSQSKCHKEYE
jgi:hypothetical protein